MLSPQACTTTHVMRLLVTHHATASCMLCYCLTHAMLLHQVRGLLNAEEVVMAAAGRYLSGVHALVATPEAALACLKMSKPPLDLTDLKVVVADEVDALLDTYPASFREVMEEAKRKGKVKENGGGMGACGFAGICR